MAKGREGVRACCILLAIMIAPVWAGNVPEAEYKGGIRINLNVQSLSAYSFGENVNLYDGNRSFAAARVGRLLERSNFWEPPRQSREFSRINNRMNGAKG